MAKTRAGKEIWLDWLGAVKILDRNDVQLCTLPKNRGRLPLKGRGAKARTGHNYFVVRDGKSVGYLTAATRAVTARLYVTPETQLCVQSHDAREKLSGRHL